MDFDSDELIEKSVSAIDNTLTVKKVIVNIATGEQKETIDETSLKSGDSMVKYKNMTEETDSLLGAVQYDLAAEITKETDLARITTVKILQKLRESTFHNSGVDPESFIKEISKIINGEKAATLINNIIYSKTERAFATDMERVEILVYAKLPNDFKIPTLVGNYNPDWAIPNDYLVDFAFI